MATAFSINDTLPKDIGGQKFTAWTNNSGSIPQFVAPWSLGASNNNSITTGYLGIATHTQGLSALSATAGVAIGGIYLESFAASPVSGGQFKVAGINNYGELYVSGTPKTASRKSGSVETYKTSSAILYGLQITGANVNVSNTVTIQDGSNDIIKFTFITASQNFVWNSPVGGVAFNTSLKQVSSITGPGAASVMLIYR